MPSGTATRIDSTVEAITSGALTSSFCASSSVTDAPFNADVPKSPERIPPIQSTYCSTSGPIEAERLAQRLDPFGRGVGAADDPGEIAGQQPQQEEHDHARDEERHDEQPQATQRGKASLVLHPAPAFRHRPQSWRINRRR